jgi:hypothetical protein
MTTDTDWFNSDAVYRNQAGTAQTNLYDTLSNLLYERNNKYRSIDNARKDWGTNRNLAGTQTAEGMASRGLLQSGIYKQNLDNRMTDFEKQANETNAAEQDVQQQYGQRDSMAAMPAQQAIVDKNYTALAGIYGLMGSKGTQAGNQYNSLLNQMRADSAARSAGNLTNTLGW